MLLIFFSYAEIDAISQRRKRGIEMPSLVKLLCIENHLFQDCRKFFKLIISYTPGLQMIRDIQMPYKSGASNR
jgi:hypothetical protein